HNARHFDGRLVGPIAAHDLKARFPLINWVETDNVGVAMKMVEEGEVDAAVASELSARYMIDHYYPQGLHYTRIDGLRRVQTAAEGHQQLAMGMKRM
ncbi:hypothetical protein, partial [Klebsiella pneumoniae]|uniref:hypothetical protein n=1 Tax=Klebsiella pneumoniae TaxID=573 RepID=UPI00210E7887